MDRLNIRNLRELSLTSGIEKSLGTFCRKMLSTSRKFPMTLWRIYKVIKTERMGSMTGISTKRNTILAIKMTTQPRTSSIRCQNTTRSFKDLPLRSLRTAMPFMAMPRMAKPASPQYYRLGSNYPRYRPGQYNQGTPSRITLFIKLPAGKTEHSQRSIGNPVFCGTFSKHQEIPRESESPKSWRASERIAMLLVHKPHNLQHSEEQVENKCHFDILAAMVMAMRMMMVMGHLITSCSMCRKLLCLVFSCN